jgi:hypothetical protein
VPGDLPKYRADQSARAIFGAATVAVRAAGVGQVLAEASRSVYGSEQTPLTVLKAATSPTVLAGSALAGFELVDLGVLAPMSASARLIDAGLKLSFAGKGMISAPSYLTSAADAGSWVAEGNPIPVRALNFVPGPNLTPSKLCVIAVFTREITEQSDIERIVREALQRSASLALDSAIFSNAAADATKPAGILNGITPLSPTAGADQRAMITDIGNLIGDLSDKGGGENPIFIASPETATALRLWAPPAFNYPILASNAISVDSVVAIESGAFVSGFGSTPEISASTEAVLHLEDTSPQPIVSAGGVAAAPSRSLFQTDCVALKMILRASWTVRGGLVAVVNSVTW